MVHVESVSTPILMAFRSTQCMHIGQSIRAHLPFQTCRIEGGSSSVPLAFGGKDEENMFVSGSAATLGQEIRLICGEWKAIKYALHR